MGLNLLKRGSSDAASTVAVTATALLGRPVGKESKVDGIDTGMDGVPGVGL